MLAETNTLTEYSRTPDFSRPFIQRYRSYTLPKLFVPNTTGKYLTSAAETYYCCSITSGTLLDTARGCAAAEYLLYRYKHITAVAVVERAGFPW